MNRPSPSRWADLWVQALSIIAQAEKHGVGPIRWTFGGGTALMLRIDHRESHDIDLFIDDPQLLPFLNPTSQGYELDLAPDDYDSDGASVLKITFKEIGEIDFICSASLTEPPADLMNVNGQDAWVETAEEIIAKKIFHRGGRMQPRDMFDIAAVLRVQGMDGLTEALRPYRNACDVALTTAEAWDSEAAARIIGQLAIRAGFKDLITSAQSDTVALLRHVLAS